MDVFVARQPIFAKTKDIYAYELLYRNNLENRFPDINGDEATTNVIINSFINIGMDELSNGKPSFINFTENLLQLQVPTFFKPDEIVVEILESVIATDEILSICKELKSKGYRIALDDFSIQSGNPYFYELVNLADIIKVDFRQTSLPMRRIIENIAFKANAKLLAEKIETKEEFDSAIQSGYEYFQGYFFSKPVILSTRDVPEYAQNYFIIMSQISKKEPDLDTISNLIEQDLSLSFKLLKLINSPAYRAKSKISSLKQAIVRLGYKELKKWLFIFSIRGTKATHDDWSREILQNSLTRAYMCELLSVNKLKNTDPSSYFLTGMFSLMDTLLGMNMSDILKLMPLQEDICEALKGTSNQLKEILDLSVYIEKAEWHHVQSWCQTRQIPEQDVLDYYAQAFKWSESLLSEDFLQEAK